MAKATNTTQATSSTIVDFDLARRKLSKAAKQNPTPSRDLWAPYLDGIGEGLWKVGAKRRAAERDAAKFQEDTGRRLAELEGKFSKQKSSPRTLKEILNRSNLPIRTQDCQRELSNLRVINGGFSKD